MKLPLNINNIIVYFGVVGTLLIATPSAAVAQRLATAAVEKSEIPSEHVVDGLIEPVKQSTVAAQLVGRIVAVNFDVDDEVAQGALLIQFDDAEQRARLQREKAAYAEAQARFTEAQVTYERTKSVYAQQLISKSDLDKSEAAMLAAQSRVEAARAGIKIAEEELSHTKVRAPYGGIVTQRHVQVGETTQIGQPLMTGLAVEHLRIQVDIPQSIIEDVKRNNRARVLLPDNRQIAVNNLNLFPYVDPQTHTLRVRADLPRNIKGVYPGMFIKVAFPIGVEQRLLVPRSAIVQRSEVTAVYVVAKDGHVLLRHVRSGKTYDDKIEILSGLEAGEQVAIDPVAAALAFKQQHADSKP